MSSRNREHPSDSTATSNSRLSITVRSTRTGLRSSARLSPYLYRRFRTPVRSSVSHVRSRFRKESPREINPSVVLGLRTAGDEFMQWRLVVNFFFSFWKSSSLQLERSRLILVFMESFKIFLVFGPLGSEFVQWKLMVNFFYFLWKSSSPSTREIEIDTGFYGKLKIFLVFLKWSGLSNLDPSGRGRCRFLVESKKSPPRN